jgi:hypothetical protein
VAFLHTLRVAQASPGRWDAGVAPVALVEEHAHVLG